MLFILQRVVLLLCLIYHFKVSWNRSTGQEILKNQNQQAFPTIKKRTETDPLKLRHATDTLPQQECQCCPGTNMSCGLWSLMLVHLQGCPPEDRLSIVWEETWWGFPILLWHRLFHALLLGTLGDTLQLLLHEQDAEGHHHTAHGHVGALPLTNPGAFPEYPQQPGFIFVQQAGSQGSDVGTGTYEQQDHSQQTLEVEYGRLWKKTGKQKITSLQCRTGKTGDPLDKSITPKMKPTMVMSQRNFAPMEYSGGREGGGENWLAS